LLDAPVPGNETFSMACWIPKAKKRDPVDRLVIHLAHWLLNAPRRGVMWVVPARLGAGLKDGDDGPAYNCVKFVEDVDAQAYPVTCGTE
jgi:hypothetical protein